METYNNTTDVYERSNLMTMLINKLPDKTKRWIFLSSLLALINNKDSISYEDDIELIKHLNDVFNLSAQPGACLFSMHIKNFIWKDTPCKIKLNNEEVSISELSKRNLSDKEIETVGIFIKNIIPSWLRYDSDVSVMNDVQLLIKQMSSAV